MKSTKLLLISVLFFFIWVNAQAQEDEKTKKYWDKTTENLAENFVDKTTQVLSKTIQQDESILLSQAQKLTKLNFRLKEGSKEITDNFRKIIFQKKALRKAWAKNPTSIQSKAIQLEIDKLKSSNNTLRKAYEKNIQKSKAYAKASSRLPVQVTTMKSAKVFLNKAGKMIANNDAIAAGGGTLGEIAAWYEGSSSFKNVIARAIKEGGKAAASVSGGALAGALTGAFSLNPIAAGGAAVAGSVAAEEFFEKYFGKSLERFMAREHDAINKYAADWKMLEKRREANRERANKEYKKVLKDIENSQSEYNDELRKYIEERNRLLAAFEEEVRQDMAAQLSLEKEQKPLVIQKPNKKKIKPGETVTISLETTGGLLPITYSGFINYTIQSGYERYLVSYKWTADKDFEPGVYEFSVKAKSASGKVGRNTVAIEILDPNPQPVAQYKSKDDGEKTYNSKDLNIKEIPGAKTREMIYKVNGIYYGHCQTPSDIKTQKFEIRLGVDPGNIEGKLGLAHFGQFAGSRTFPMTESMKEAVLVKLREKGYMAHLPYPEYLDDFYTVYFHTWGRDKKFDPVSGRVWGELEGEWSTFDTYVTKTDFKGFLEAKLNNGVITGTVKFALKGDDYSFPFTAKQ